MAEYLSVAQMKKLQEVMLKNLNEESLQKKQISNEEYLSMFVAAKNIEGCSKRTLSYYESTIETMLDEIKIPARKVTTEDMRQYLADYQKRNDCRCKRDLAMIDLLYSTGIRVGELVNLNILM